MAQKIHIEENEDRDTGLEQRHYKEDADCVLAKVPLGDLDLYDGTYISLDSKDIRLGMRATSLFNQTLDGPCFCHDSVLVWDAACELAKSILDIIYQRIGLDIEPDIPI